MIFFFFFQFNGNCTKVGQGGSAVLVRIASGNTVHLSTREILEGGFIEHRIKNIHYARKQRATNEGTGTVISQCNRN